MTIKAQAQEILKTLTLEEKIALQTGVDRWNTFGVEQKGLPSIAVSDGPHGLRKEVESKGELAPSEQAVCFPTASKLGCSFDSQLVKDVGVELAQQCLAQNVAVILGPGINIKRNTLCGRNFEYFSEDPMLAGVLGSAFVEGVQSQGVGVSLKHFAANSQEYGRLVSDSVVDQKALREIYLKAFEMVVKNAKPATLMCAYNKLNGEYCSENKTLLTDILRDEWGFDGVVMSDWGAVNDRAKGIKAGLDLQMPHGDLFPVFDALKGGEIDENDLDKCVLRIIELALKYKTLKPTTSSNQKAHELAKKVSGECTVLAKNSCDILPLKQNTRLAVIGDLARNPHFQGGGSSRVNPSQVTSICDALKEQGIEFDFAEGYDSRGESNIQMLEKANEVAKNADTVLLVVGLTDAIEFEGFDRKSMSLPQGNLDLIDVVTNANSNVVAVLQCGSPVDMSWQNSVKAVLLDYLSGQAGGGAIVDIVFGKTNPSGRVAETWVLDKDDQPSTENFANDVNRVLYKESIFVGYRYFDTAKVAVRYPFGYGLSYTQFKYQNVKLSQNAIKNTDSVTVSMDIQNIGDFDGKEVVQIYIKNCDHKGICENKSLKAFKKVEIKKGKTQNVQIELNNDAFSYFNTAQNKFVVDGGRYKIFVSQNVNQSIAELDLTIEGENTSVDVREKLPSYFDLDQTKKLTVSDSEFQTLIKRPLPNYTRSKRQPHTINSTFTQIKDRFWGRVLNKIVDGQLKKMTENDPTNAQSYRESVDTGPLRILMMMGMSLKFVYALTDFVNGKVIRAVFAMLKEVRKMKKQSKQSKKSIQTY